MAAGLRSPQEIVGRRGRDLEEVYDELWYVYVKTEVRKNRLFYSRGYKESKIDDIMASQLTKEQFMKECDRVIDNNGVFAETMIQIDQIVKNL